MFFTAEDAEDAEEQPPRELVASFTPVNIPDR